MEVISGFVVRFEDRFFVNCGDSFYLINHNFTFESGQLLEEQFNFELKKVMIARGSGIRVEGYSHLLPAAKDQYGNFYIKEAHLIKGSIIVVDSELSWEIAEEEAKTYAQLRSGLDSMENNVHDTYFDNYKYYLKTHFKLQRI